MWIYLSANVEVRLCFVDRVVKFIGVGDGAVCEAQVRFRMGILGFFTDLILPAALWLWCQLSL